MQRNKKKTKSKIITEKLRKKHGACEHNQVSYKAMEKLVNIAFKRSKQDAKVIKDLAKRISQDAFFAKDTPGGFKILINDIKLKHERIKKLTEERDNLKKELEENDKGYRDLIEKLRSKFFGRSYDALRRYALGRDKTKDN